MLPLRRRYLVLSWLAILLGGGTLVVMVTATRLYAEGTLPVEAIPFLNWLSFSGLVSLGLVLIRWGEMRERMKDVPALRIEMHAELGKINGRLDTLFELLGVNRRSVDRRRFGERIEGDDPS
jgi:hypothetical protein